MIPYWSPPQLSNNTLDTWNLIKNLSLYILAPPDPPTISGSDLRATTDSVTLRWEYGDSGKNPVTSVTIKYRNSTDETWTKIQIHQHIREYVVTNLQENTMYEFKIQASNAVGPSKYSKVVRKPTDSSLLGKF